MGWVSAEDYGSALPDPLAKAAPGIIRHMNVRSRAGLQGKPPTRRR
jgi:hypothetical protein